MLTFYKTCLMACLFLSSTICSAEIIVKDTYEPSDPVVITCKTEKETSDHTIFNWKYSDKLKNGVIKVEKDCLHIWASKGTYEIECISIIPRTINLTVLIRDTSFPDDIGKAKIQDRDVIEGFSVEVYNQTFSVIDSKVDPTPTPTPTPDPTPDPTPTPDPVPTPVKKDPIPAVGFHVIIVEETADRAFPDKVSREQVLTLKSSMLRSLVENQYGGTFRLVDDDCNYSRSNPNLQKVVDQIKKDKRTLPWMIISNDSKWYQGPVLPLEQTLEIIKTHEPR